MVASGVWAGRIPLEQAWNLRDMSSPSVTLKSELQRHGYLGQTPCSADPSTGIPLGANFELHIEQGPILEASRKKIGVVLGAQAYRWLTLTVSGRNAHTGTTPLSARKDSLLAAAKMIASSSEIAEQLGALASAGVIKTPPGSSVNTLPSQVSFTLDLRHPRDSVVIEMHERCLASFREIARRDGKGVDVSWTLDVDSPAVDFDADCVAAVRRAAGSLLGPDACLDMTGGAGHDGRSRPRQRVHQPAVPDGHDLRPVQGRLEPSPRGVLQRRGLVSLGSSSWASDVRSPPLQCHRRPSIAGLGPRLRRGPMKTGVGLGGRQAECAHGRRPARGQALRNLHPNSSTNPSSCVMYTASAHLSTSTTSARALRAYRKNARNVTKKLLHF